MINHAIEDRNMNRRCTMEDNSMINFFYWNYRLLFHVFWKGVYWLFLPYVTQKWSSYNIISIWTVGMSTMKGTRFIDVPYWHYKEMLILHVFRPYIRNRNSSPFILLCSYAYTAHVQKIQIFMVMKLEATYFSSKWRIALKKMIGS